MATLAAERLRLTALAGENRTWRWPDWARYYRDHPVTGVPARALDWEYEPSDGLGYRPLDTGAARESIPPTARVRLRPTATAGH